MGEEETEMVWVTIPCKKLLRVIALVIALCLSALCAAFCFLTPAAEEGVFLPILMYHSVLKDPSKTGKYVITPESLEEDLQYLRQHGYQTVVMQDVIDFVYNGVPLPEKPVVLTFDDGFYNNLTYLLPLLIEYDMKAIVAPVGEYTEQFSENPDPNPAYAYLSWDDISTLEESGHVEIQNHSYSMHAQTGRHGTLRKSNESMDEYQITLQKDLQKMQDLLTEHCEITPTTFVYPFGQICEGSLPVVKEMGFLASFSCYERANYLTNDPDCLYELGRYNRSGLETTEKIMKKAGII